MSSDSGNQNLDKPESRRPARRFRYSEAAPTPTPTNADTALLELPRNELDWQWIWLALACVGVGMLLFYPMDIRSLVSTWASDPGWGHGFVIPVISLFFVRLKWDSLKRLVPRGTMWGLLPLFVGIAGQVLFRMTGVQHMSRLSMPVVLYGTVLFVLGWEFMKMLWLPISYLVLAFPPPDTLYVAMTAPMRTVAAELGVQLLPLFGLSGDRQGQTINVFYAGKVSTLEVEDACSGMKMLVAFIALAVAMAYSTDRPMWQKVTLASFAIPIAIVCNGLRVAVTGFLAARVNESLAHGNAHIYLGFLAMLPPAMGLQLLLGWILDKIFVDMPDVPAKGVA